MALVQLPYLHNPVYHEVTPEDEYFDVKTDRP